MSGSIDAAQDYVLEDQVGFLLRLASQRHSAIFQSRSIDGLTPTQFSTLLRVSEHKEVSQNQLGRLAAMDVATIKGVVDRLKARKLIQAKDDPNDRRRMLISLTPAGEELISALKRVGHEISEETLKPLTEAERDTLIRLLKKLS